MPRTGILFILVGPSGAGKNTLMQRVQHQLDNLPQLATMTTRPPREGEQNGREHWFVSLDEFQHLIETDALIEWQQVHLNDLYGTPRQTVENALNANSDLIADIEFLGADKIHEAYPDHTVLIFVTPSSLDILTERIRKRGAITPKALTNRIERAKFEMSFAPQCDYLIVNDMLEQAADDLRRIVLHERAQRRDHQASNLEKSIFHCTITAVIRYEDKLLTRDGLLPAFPLLDLNQPPHEALQEALQQTFNQHFTIGATSDSRFDFVAPDHITLDAKPPHIYLDFYYLCEPTSYNTFNGWTWQPLSSLNLPAPIGELTPS